MLNIRNFNPALQEHMMRGIYGDKEVNQFLQKGGEFRRKGVPANRVGASLHKVSKQPSPKNSDQQVTPNPIAPNTDVSRVFGPSMSQN